MAMVRCPHCDAALTLSEWDTGRCPACKREFAEAPVSGRYSRELPDISYGGGVSLARWSFLPWATTRTGLGLVAAGSAVALACFVLIELLSIGAVEHDLFFRADSFLAAFLGLLGIVFAAGLTVLIVGSGLCCVVPADSGQKGWVIGTLISHVFVGLTLFVMIILSAQMNVDRFDDGLDRRFEAPVAMGAGISPRTVQLMTYVVYFAVLVSKTLFICFLAGVAGYFRAGGLRVSVLIYLGVSLLVDLIFFLLFILATRAGGLDRELTHTLSWIRLAFYTPLFVWFIVQVLLVRGVITDGLTRNWTADRD